MSNRFYYYYYVCVCIMILRINGRTSGHIVVDILVLRANTPWANYTLLGWLCARVQALAASFNHFPFITWHIYRMIFAPSDMCGEYFFANFVDKTELGNIQTCNMESREKKFRSHIGVVNQLNYAQLHAMTLFSFDTPANRYFSVIFFFFLLFWSN